MFGILLLNDWTFLNIALGVAIIYTVSINFSLLFPYYLQETVQLSRTDTALAMTILACGDVLSRVTVPIVTDHFSISARVTLLLGLSVVIVIRTLLAESQSVSQILIISFSFGYFRALTVVNQNLCLAEYFPDQQLLCSAIGLTMILKAVTVITVGQLLGIMRDLTSSYSISLHIQNSIVAVVLISWTGELIYKKWRSSAGKKRKQFERL